MNGQFTIVDGSTHVYLVLIGRGLAEDPTSDTCPHTHLEKVKVLYRASQVDHYLWACSDCWAVREIDEVRAA